MGKTKGGSHKRTKAPLVRTGLKILLVVDGGRRVADAIEKNWSGAAYIAGTKKKSIQAAVYAVSGYDLTQEKGQPKNIGDQGALIGGAEIFAGPKGVDIAYRAIPVPEIKRLKVPGSARKVL
jgi:hypothetical protein